MMPDRAALLAGLVERLLDCSAPSTAPPRRRRLGVCPLLCSRDRLPCGHAEAPLGCVSVNPQDRRTRTAAGRGSGWKRNSLSSTQLPGPWCRWAEELVDRAKPTLGGRVSGEITKFQVETRTGPCLDVGQVLGELAGARAELSAAAGAEGLRIIASGTPVLGDVVPQPITEGPRQERGTAMFRGLHDELSLCAMHVHVEMPDRERAVLVSNHLRQYLPTIIALAANSPYWPEQDTGYASWRTIAWTRWPVAGPPPYFTSAAHYDELVATLTRGRQPRRQRHHILGHPAVAALPDA